MESLICLVHELGHVIHFYTTGNRPKNYDRIIIIPLKQFVNVNLTIIHFDEGAKFPNLLTLILQIWYNYA